MKLEKIQHGALLLFFFLSLLACNTIEPYDPAVNKANYEKLILGKWEGVEEVDLKTGQKESLSSVVVEFFPDKTWKNFDEGRLITEGIYSIKESELTLTGDDGTDSYKIITLNSSTLEVEGSDDDYEFKYKFKKI